MNKEHEQLHREALEALGWTNLHPVGSATGLRLFGDAPNCGTSTRVPDLYDPAFAAELRAEIVRRGWHVTLNTNQHLTSVVVEDKFRVEIFPEEEPDPIRRECLATTSAFVAAVRATKEKETQQS